LRFFPPVLPPGSQSLISPVDLDPLAKSLTGRSRLAIGLLGHRHGLVGFLREHDSFFLYYLGLTVFVGSYMIAVSYRFSPWIADWFLELKWVFISSFFTLFFVYRFIRSFLGHPRNWSDVVLLTLTISATLAMPCVHRDHPSWMYWIHNFWAAVFMVFIPAVAKWIWTLHRSLKSLDTAAVLLAFIFLILCVLRDIILQYFDTSIILWNTYAFMLFTVSLGFLLAKEHGKALHLAERDPMTGLFKRDAFEKP